MELIVFIVLYMAFGLGTSHDVVKRLGTNAVVVEDYVFVTILWPMFWLGYIAVLIWSVFRVDPD